MQTTKGYYSKLIEGNRKPLAGDLIFSRNATVGEVAQVAEWHPPFAMGQDVCLLRKRKANYSTVYLQTVIKSTIIRKQLENLMVGSTFKRVNIEQIRTFFIPFPSHEEQSAIATALSDADALISSLEILIAKKRNIKQGAMQKLMVNGELLMVNEVNGELLMVNGEKNNSPLTTHHSPLKSGWEVKKLGEVCENIGSGKSKTQSQEGKFPIFGSTGIIGWSNTFDYSGHKILVARVGANAGTANIVDGNYCVSDNTLMVALKPEIDLNFIYNFLILFRLNKLVFGSGQPLITGGQLKNIEISLPTTKEEQTRIATILSDMDAEINALETK